MNHNAILISSNNSDELKSFMEMNEYDLPWVKHTDFSYSNYIKSEKSVLHSLLLKSVEFPNTHFKLSFFREYIKFPSAGQYKIFNGTEECVKYWSPEKCTGNGKKFFETMSKLFFPTISCVWEM
jgi:hypothetical protein